MGMFDWIVRAGVQDASARLLPQRIELPAVVAAGGGSVQHHAVGPGGAW